MASRLQNEQDSAVPTFAVDTDITPMQAQYFQAAEQRFTNPEALGRAYSQIVDTFGSIQQARDIQKERQQKDEDRAIQNQLRNTQLDASRFELAQARDKVRERQQSLAQSSGFLQGLNQIKSQFANDPAAAYSALNDFGAQNAGAFENPLNKTAFELTLNSLRTPKELQPKRADELPEGVKKAAADAAASGNTSAADSLGLSNDPSFGAYLAQSTAEQSSKNLAKKKSEENKATLGTIKVSEKLNSFLDPVKYIDLPITQIDAGLKELNRKKLLTDEDKNQLSDAGITIGGIIPAKRGKWPSISASASEEAKTEYSLAKKALSDKQRKVVGEIASRFVFGGLASGAEEESTTPAGKVDFNSLGE
jgi:hypothetical protein